MIRFAAPLAALLALAAAPAARAAAQGAPPAAAAPSAKPAPASPSAKVAPAGGAPAKAARPRPAAVASAQVFKGVRFELPRGYPVERRPEEAEGEPDDVLFVAARGAVEVRAEVEDGRLDCSGADSELPGVSREGTSASGRRTCEYETAAPPSLVTGVQARRAASVAVDFGERHFQVLVFAPDAAQALALARQVAATAELAAP